MEATFSEWRRPGSTCRGALVFWLKDFWDGAGWGVIDAGGMPKSVYFHLARVLQPATLVCTDEGLNGVFFHAINETPRALNVTLVVSLYRAGEIVVATGERAVTLEPRTTTTFRADSLLGRFADSAYAYRFGPPGHDVVLGELRAGVEVVARAFHFPLGRRFPQELDLGLTARFVTQQGRPGVEVSTRRFAQCVSLDIPGHVPADDSFHLEPGGRRWVPLRSRAGATGLRGLVRALNGLGSVPIAAESSEGRGTS
jgi:beta-mannosidase